jgi:Uma2 family endonuclease
MDTAKKIQGQYSLAEYLKLEEEANSKHEYWNGTILAMAGGTPSHNKIANSIGTAIDIELDKMNKDCSVYNSDQKVYISAFNRCVYPDCMLICGEEELHENSTSIIVNPSLIIEVLSETSKEYDSNSKFEGIEVSPPLKSMCWSGKPYLKCNSGLKKKKIYGGYPALLD